MRFHVVALPHTQTSRKHNACAFTMKTYNFCRMMRSLGHTVIHYGAEGSEADCDEHVQIISQAEQDQLCGQQGGNRLYNIQWDIRAPYWCVTNGRAVEEIRRRMQPRDFICLIGGTCQKPVADALGKSVMVVEYGIGYNGTFAPFRVFESYAHQARIYGQESPNADPDGRYYDAVIPNYFDPADFPFGPAAGDYFLYLGRLIKRKGIHIAVEIAKAAGAKLVIAGQGCVARGPNWIQCEDGERYEGDFIEFVGHADVAKRAQLMSGAKAILVPTVYLEPFGGVNVEAQLCGTPAITTDWGAFPETVAHGQTGYRCRTLDQFVWAARNVERLDRWRIHERAVENWSLWRVRWMYQEYFQMLFDLWDEGWYTLRDRADLNWLAKR
jgi:glycosyltransferase involved in cell wall biosynthesis